MIIKNIPGIAFTDNKVSAKCCHLFAKDGEAREAGKVINATAFEDRTMLFKDLMKKSISHSYNVLRDISNLKLATRIPIPQTCDFEK